MAEDSSPLWWTVGRLTAAYRSGELSPVEVATLARERIVEIDPTLHAFVGDTSELAGRQAQAAELAYRDGSAERLAGVPVTIKDAFHVQGHVTTLGSLAHKGDVAPADSGAVRRLRDAGAVFVGKTNVSEFCQSATTDNLLGPDSANPWDPTRTPGGSSGGAAASVAAGSCTLAIGSDGGGSIRIPAAFCGLVGLKPGHGVLADEGGFKAFSPFISLGPLARTVGDARQMYLALGGDLQPPPPELVPPTIRWCAQPEDRPVEAAMLSGLSTAVDALGDLGAMVEADDLDIGGWAEIFGPQILAEEHDRRDHLLDAAHGLTDYERTTLEAARRLDPDVLATARAGHAEYRRRVDAEFVNCDLLVTPATATRPFPLGERPTEIAGRRVSRTWGAFPFAVPFNVSGHPAITLPVGIVDGLPVAVQLVGRFGSEALLLDVAEALEATLGLDLFPHP